MPRSKPWLKMWVESLDDPKMLRLTMAEEAAWWRLLRLAQRCNAGGSLITSSGSPLTRQEITACLHITSPNDLATFDSMLKKMEAEGSLLWNDESLHIIHFQERQEMAASETPEAIRERVRRYREQHRVTETSLQTKESVPSPLIPPISKDREGYIEGEQIRYVTAENSLHHAQGNEKSVTDTTLKKEKKTYLTNVYLTEEEHKKLVEQFGTSGAKDRIEALSLYIESKGAQRKYKSHYATILNWERMAKQQGGKDAGFKGGKAEQQLPTTKELKEGWKR